MTVELPTQANLCEYFLTRRLAEGRGPATAILTESATYTFSDVDVLAAQAAELLLANGVRKEERVLIMLRDSIEFVAAFFGALRMGAVVCMVNPDVKPQDVEHYLEYTGARALLADPSMAATVNALPQAVRPLCCWVGDDGKAGFLAALRRMPGVFAPVPVHVDDPAIWLFTSGSTGIPKAVVHRAGDYIFSTEVFARRTIGYLPSDVTVSVPKLFFGYATGTNLMFPFAHGAAAALFPERSTAEYVLRACARHKATVLTGVPTMMSAMLALAEKDPSVLDALKSVRFMFSAGEALPGELYQRWKTTTGVEVYDGIGSAEMFHIYITNRPGDVRGGSLGKLVEGYAARLVDDEGHDVPDGEIGTLHITGKSVGLCYWRDREKSYHTFRGETCVTADKFSRDQERYYTYHGRADDLLKVGGRWVAPVEVENVLLSHPDVEACCVVGKTDVEGLEKPLAFVVVRPGCQGSDALVEALKQHVKDRLQPYKYPREIRFVTSLPKNDRGKVDRKVLRGQV